MTYEWKPKGDKIKTIFSEKVDPNNPLPEYPRPNLIRESWLNLNGLWDYTITDISNTEIPNSFPEKILVPFPLESSLSGVMKQLTEKQILWYYKKFKIPKDWIIKEENDKKKNKIIINFGAIDWSSEIYINNKLVGNHIGGYTPFNFDITDYLTYEEETLIVKVIDPTDKGYQPIGKQNLRPGFIFYTPVSGIWQTVWIEPVNSENYIKSINYVTDIDKGDVTFIFNCCENDKIDIEIYDNDNKELILKSNGECNKNILINIPNCNLWSPSNPYLYILKVNLIKNDKILDSIKSYFALRKISYSKDEKGINRIELNNKKIFCLGLLDQGWWPDGLYTAPTDEALQYDIIKTKQLNYNTIRKHVKVESARWYYHCDKIGILVWQDMVSGDLGPFYLFTWKPKEIGGGSDRPRTQISIENYKKEYEDIINFTKNFPCVIMYIPFNEGWGQFNTEEITQFTKDKLINCDNKLINSASGGNHRNCGDILDLHNYPEPKMFLKDENKINILGEYGGVGNEVENHVWNDKCWAYIKKRNGEEVTSDYVKYGNMLIDLINDGFSAAIYTQTTDCEVEINGLMTYDRKVLKVDEEKIKEINKKIIDKI